MASTASQPATTSGGDGVSLAQRIIKLLRNPLQVAGLVIVIFLVWTIIQNLTGLAAVGRPLSVERIIRVIIFGLAQGSIYALIALGYTLVYGILSMINFAHSEVFISEVFMSGAYIGFFAIHWAEQSGLLYSNTALALLITVTVGMAAAVTIAVLLERIAYRPLRGAPRLVPLITAIGASIALQQIFLRLFGSATRVYPEVNFYVLPQLFRLECETIDGAEICKGMDLINGRYDVQLLGMELQLRPIFFVVFFLAVLMMAILWYIVRRTKIGKAMRAVAEDRKTASLMGINVDRVIVSTFILGAALAGAAGVCYLPCITPRCLRLWALHQVLRLLQPP